jgi:hypothetical protein
MAQTSMIEDERIEAMLEERGITGTVTLMAEIVDLAVDDKLATIKWWDDIPGGRKSTGLLINKLREGGVKGYKRPHERQGVDGEVLVGPAQLANIRAIALSTHGMFRSDVEHIFTRLAEKAGSTVAALIDESVAPGWKETPPHPAHIYTGVGDPGGMVRYEEFVTRYGRDIPDRPDPTVTRNVGETELSYAMRFWNWKDQKTHDERVKTMVELSTARRLVARQRADAEAERTRREDEQRRAAVSAAVTTERTDHLERATQAKRTDGDERARATESTDPLERADHMERTEETERALTPAEQAAADQFGEEAPWDDEDLGPTPADFPAKDGESEWW